MFSIERHNEILLLLKAKKSVTVKELSQVFYVSEATIRRDLVKLNKLGVLRKTFGGAVLLEGLDTEIPLSVRETEQRNEKEIIGALASKMVHNDHIIILDSSSTTLKMAPYLHTLENLTVITNGAKTAIELGEFLHTQVYATGGKLRENSLSYIGEHARNAIQNFYVDLLFFSCRGLSLEYGLYDSNPEEAELRKIMITQSKKTVLLCDHTKFDKESFCKISDFHNIHVVVTDRCPSEKWVRFFSEQKIELIYR
jgi:DeoR/GlpR family transcriptional regulator of sugar metabolism